jgi:hypothetical protein
MIFFEALFGIFFVIMSFFGTIAGVVFTGVKLYSYLEKHYSDYVTIGGMITYGVFIFSAFFALLVTFIGG